MSKFAIAVGFGHGLYISEDGEQYGAPDLTIYLTSAKLFERGNVATAVSDAWQKFEHAFAFEVTPADLYEDEMERAYRYGRWAA